MRVASARLRTFMQALLALLCLGFSTQVFLGCALQAQELMASTTLGASTLIAGQQQVLPLRVQMRGLALESAHRRAPVNIAIVLDRSGSMQGDKLQRAKDAAIMAIQRLDRDDIAALVTYDDVVEVVVPATKVSERHAIINAINAIQARGSTALFAGVSRAAHEVQKFIEKNKVNRIILISDGLANVGPSSAGELGDLGASFMRQGISVSTIGLGLGYNEDLMAQLAGRSDGNHFFVENANDLAQAFQRELGDILSVVARDVEITITCAEGFRPIRVLGLEAQIYGQEVRVPLNQLYANQEKYVVLEVEAASSSTGVTRPAAQVRINYFHLGRKRSESIQQSAAVSYSSSAELAKRSVDRPTMEAYYTQLTLDNSSRAIALRDANRKDEAQQILRSNAQLLNEKAAQYNIPALNSQAGAFENQAAQMDQESWGRQRKGLTEYNYKVQKQKR